MVFYSFGLSNPSEEAPEPLLSNFPRGFRQNLWAIYLAAVMGCSPGTVKSQTAKALESLRRVMAAERGRQNA